MLDQMCQDLKTTCKLIIRKTIKDKRIRTQVQEEIRNQMKLWRKGMIQELSYLCSGARRRETYLKDKEKQQKQSLLTSKSTANGAEQELKELVHAAQQREETDLAQLAQQEMDRILSAFGRLQELNSQQQRDMVLTVGGIYNATVQQIVETESSTPIQNPSAMMIAITLEYQLNALISLQRQHIAEFIPYVESAIKQIRDTVVECLEQIKQSLHEIDDQYPVPIGSATDSIQRIQDSLQKQKMTSELLATAKQQVDELLRRTEIDTVQSMLEQHFPGVQVKPLPDLPEEPVLHTTSSDDTNHREYDDDDEAELQ